MEWSVKEFLDRTASDEPTPGGGSVAALVGALGAALGCMVCRFTVGKKKFKDVEEEVKGILERCEKLREELRGLIQADIDAYQKVSAAYAMPRKTPEEKEARSKAIKEALKEALEIPMKVAEDSLEVLRHARRLAEIGNPNLIGDAGCAAAFALAALEAACVLAKGNLSWIKDEELTRQLSPKIESLQSEARKLCEETLKLATP